MFSFLKDQGYVWETGLAGHFTYGPKGTQLKNNIQNVTKKYFEKMDYVEIDTPLIYKREVWENSGHWDKFQDPLIFDESDRCLRLDKVLEQYYPGIVFEDLDHPKIWELLQEVNDKLREQGESLLKIPPFKEGGTLNIQYRNLMMVSRSGDQESGLRPETATATFYNFPELFVYFNKQYPIKVYQIGKSFRNEISPKNNIIRCREFTQGEFQVFLPESLKNTHFFAEDFFSKEPNLMVNVKYNNNSNSNEKVNFWNLNIPGAYYRELLFYTYGLFIELGIPEGKIRLRQHAESERAFYALDAWDIEVQLNELGWTEIAGIHDRGTYDLRNLKLKKNRPHILEIAIGMDRLFYAIIDSLYEKKDVVEGKTILKLPLNLAITQVAVLPLVANNPEIVKIATTIHQNLKGKYRTQYLEKNSIGKRYAKCAELGVPFAVTIDHQSLDDKQVTLRSRDTEQQVRISINELNQFLNNL